MSTDTKSLTKTLSNHFVLDRQGQLSTSSLLLLGLAAGLLHVHLRYPLNIPGHHGLEWMALLFFGRQMSNHPQAATLLASAAATGYLLQSPFLALAHSIKPALVFLGTGIGLDLCTRFARPLHRGTLLNSVLGGLIFCLKPVVMYSLYLFTGLQVGMFIKHPDYLPFISHFAFGATGACIGILMATALKKHVQPDN